MISRPTHINVFRSHEKLLAREFDLIPIDEVESIIAKHRGIKSFRWAEYLPENEAYLNENISQLITPDQLAICYLGEDIGYATVSLIPLLPGRFTVFAGDINDESMSEDTNIYQTVAKENGQDFTVNAKHIGGFSSMAMDAPMTTAANISDFYNHVALNFTKKTKLKQTLLQSVAAGYVPDKIYGKIFLQRINMPVGAFEFISIPYMPRNRLLYKEFIGFDKQCFRLNPAMNALLNKYIYRPLLLSGLSNFHRDLFFITKYLERNKYSKAVNNLLKMDQMVRVKLLETLTPGELGELIANTSNQAFKSATDQLKNVLITALVTHPSANAMKDHRRLIRMVIECNRKQVALRGGITCRIEALAGHRAVLYPGLVEDYLAIGKEYELLTGYGAYKESFFNSARMCAAKIHALTNDSILAKACLELRIDNRYELFKDYIADLVCLMLSRKFLTGGKQHDITKHNTLNIIKHEIIDALNQDLLTQTKVSILGKIVDLKNLADEIAGQMNCASPFKLFTNTDIKTTGLVKLFYEAITAKAKIALDNLSVTQRRDQIQHAFCVAILPHATQAELGQLLYENNRDKKDFVL